MAERVAEGEASLPVGQLGLQHAWSDT